MALYNSFFEHQTYRKCLVAFGSLFSNIQVVRYNEDNTENSRERVPLIYGPKEKYIYRTIQDASFENPLGNKLPRMVYEDTSIFYATDRQHSPMQKFFSKNINNTRYQHYQPVPYDMAISLYVASTTIDEGMQIVEQILPFFAPDITLSVELIPEMENRIDIPISLLGISQEDTWDGSFEERRAITWTLDFTLRSYFFGPVRTPGVIKQVEINLDGQPDPQVSIVNNQGIVTVTE